MLKSKGMPLARVLEGLLEDVDMSQLERTLNQEPGYYRPKLPKLKRRPRRFAVMPKTWWWYLPASPPGHTLKP